MSSFEAPVQLASVPYFALLDDCAASPEAPSSRLYTDFSHQHICADVESAHWVRVCEALEAEMRTGLHAVVLADYEWGARMQLGKRCAAPTARSPSLRFLMFRNCTRLSKQQTDTWLAAQEENEEAPVEVPVSGLAHLRSSIDFAQFEAALQRIQAALRAGDVYQVNFTWRFIFDVFGTPLALYQRLRARQPTPFGALIALPDKRWVLSCSPELFVQHSAGQLTARPMKGTAARGGDASADAHAAEQLAADPKNRAENLMIVDLLRNDLGRIARTGSVHVSKLFSVEPYARLWQMTSTLNAVRRAEVRLADIIRALFPCGSITGAPKMRAMQWIDTLERSPRGLYTGAIGWLDAPASISAHTMETAQVQSEVQSGRVECGDFCFSVAIRTVMLEAPRADGLRQGSLGVGSGIVLDSEAAQEYEECQLKARFLTDLDPGFALIETMCATRARGIHHLERHCARLAHSADIFGFKYSRAALDCALASTLTALPSNKPYRLRLTLRKNGAIEVQTAALALLSEPVSVLFAHDAGLAAVNPDELWLRHKTTLRTRHTRALHEAAQRGAFDLLFLNTRGELTEGVRSNVFVKLNGRWFTPPLTSGLLPGVMRAVLLDDPAWNAAERVLTQAEVYGAEHIMVCNALHGALEVRLMRAAS